MEERQTRFGRMAGRVKDSHVKGEGRLFGWAATAFVVTALFALGLVGWALLGLGHAVLDPHRAVKSIEPNPSTLIARAQRALTAASRSQRAPAHTPSLADQPTDRTDPLEAALGWQSSPVPSPTPTPTPTPSPTIIPAPTSAPAISTAGSGLDWAALRQCESGGNYSINTGNGFYGAYQFDLGTWHGVGGVGYPHEAAPAEQDKRAQILYDDRGAAPWPVCGDLL